MDNSKNPMKLSKNRYSNISQMVRGTAEDPAFATEFEKRLSERKLIRSLKALRCMQGFSQRDLGEKMGHTQGKVSKLEAMSDRDIALGDFVKYADALGHEIRIFVAPQTLTGADRVKFFAAGLKRELDRLVTLAGQDESIGDGVESFALETMQNLLMMIEDAITRLPHRQQVSSAALQVEVKLPTAKARGISG